MFAQDISLKIKNPLCCHLALLNSKSCNAKESAIKNIFKVCMNYFRLKLPSVSILLFFAPQMSLNGITYCSLLRPY